MATETNAYNLLDEQWIPVLWADGKFTHVGIKEALTEAHRIRQIAASNPMDRVAILRFLLALLYWCKGNPPDGGADNLGDSFPAGWFSKLDEKRECFNLLGEGKRFYQEPAAQRWRAVTDLLQEVPTGNNFWHFRHSTDEQDGLCLACCALGLLRLPLFSVSGLPDLKSGINGVPPVYVIPIGSTVKYTLVANWVKREAFGVPAWEQPSVRPPDDGDVPILTGLTALSRLVWLHEMTEPVSMCIGCGATGKVIRICQFQSAGRLENTRWNDPHVMYSATSPRKSSKAADLTAAGKFRMDRPWPALVARIAAQNKKEHTSLLIVGFATDNAKNVDVWERVVDAPCGQDGAVLLAEKWQKEGKRLERRAGRSKASGLAAVTAIRPHVEGVVSARAGELLAGDETGWQKAAEEYRPMMKMIAKSLSPGFTTSAVRRRRQISNAVPDMRPKTETQKKSKQKKGG